MIEFKDGDYCTQQHPGTPLDAYCPSCRKGHLIKRIGKHGQFYGCCRYPICSFTCNSSEASNWYDPDPDEPYFGM